MSAPAGFGKTTALAEWLAAAPDHRSQTAWLSLDAGDNRPASFWTHVIAALQGVAPGIGAGVLGALESADPSIETVVAPLLNELGVVPDDIVLVLDDFHAIEATQLLAGVEFLVDHLPANVHLVLATRADPPLPLARLRVRGDLVEVRAADLRFSPAEAAAYLNDVMGLALAAPDIAALEARTEGWVAAIQLAGLSMQGRDDVSGFIAGFAGDDRYVVDYLMEEVLRRQPEQVRTFMLETSILTSMTGPLVDAVTGQRGGSATLEALDRGNLFLVPLDDRRQWYRYHHLFGDVLLARLLDERAAEVPGLHRRASDWYELKGERSEAIRHAMAGHDDARAADLVELAMPAMRQRREEDALRRWLDALPRELIVQRPVLSTGYAGVLLATGELDGVDDLLASVERWLHATSQAGEPPSGIVVDDGMVPRLPAGIAMYRAAQARMLGDVPGTMAHASRALDLVAEDDHLGRGGAAALLGLAYWTTGDLDAAYRWFADGVLQLEQGGHLADVVGGAITLTDIRLTQGRQTEALSLFERGLAMATQPGSPILRGASDMHVGISRILRERNDLGGARQHLSQSEQLGEANGLPQNRHRWRIAMAQIRQAEGDLDGALELLTEAERLYVGDFSPDARPISAMIARVWIAQGRLGDAWGWAREQGLSAADDLTYIREFEHTTLARLLLAQGSHDRAEPSLVEASELAERLLAAAESAGRNGSAIEILVVLALARDSRGDQAGARAALERALALAEPEGYVRVFVDEGPSMAALLRLMAKDRAASSYVRQLLAAAMTTARETAREQPLIEPLSERELEVLRLLESDFDGPDIARELSVSLPTVRTHTRNIYAKLGVTSRRAAVRRAAELGLLAPPGAPARLVALRRGCHEKIITSLIACGDVRSSHSLRLFGWADQIGITGRRPSREHARGAA